MTIKEINAKSILRKQKKIDSWFISCCGMNLYRGCTHDCAYCDGRAEKYNVEGEFGTEVAVKVNAIDLLRCELDPKRKRTPLKHGFVMVGGGVGDSYQPAEEQYQLTRQTLQLLSEYHLPAHILTKSTLVERDMDILQELNHNSRVILSMSFSSADDSISAIMEPGVPSPTERFNTLVKFKQCGFTCGMFLMPVIPFVTDLPEVMDATLRKAHEIGLDFVVFGGMTLKNGRQKDFFLNTLQQHYPQFTEAYHLLYPVDKYGGASPDYYQTLHQTFNRLATRKYQLPKRIPARVFHDILSDSDRVIVMLEQLDYLLKQEGKSSPYGYAAYSISQLKNPLTTMHGMLRTIKGVGPVT